MSFDNGRPEPRQPRRPRRDGELPPPPPAGGRADQGDLWAGDDAAPGAASAPPPHPSPAETPPAPPRRGAGAPSRTSPNGPARPANPLTRGYGAPAAAGDDLDDFIADLPPPDEAPAVPAWQAASRRPVAPPPVYDPYEDEYEPAEYSMLRNPYVLAALAVAGAIILAVVFVIAFSEGGDRAPGVVVGERTPTPLPGELPGVQAEVLAIAAIREGPGLEYFELGLLRTGQDVSVVGRNEDSSWYQVIFAGADLRGWVPDSALRLPDGADDQIEVVLFTPIPKPSVEQPTPTPQAEPTEVATDPPDISVELLGNVCPTTGVINIALRNVGDVDVTGREVILTVSTPDGVLSEQNLSLTLGVGQIVPVNTGLQAEPPTTMIAVVFAGSPQDLDPSNNVVACVVDDDDNGGSNRGPGLNATSVPPNPNEEDD